MPFSLIVSMMGSSPAKAPALNGSPLIILCAVRSNVDCRQKVGKVTNPHMTASASESGDKNACQHNIIAPPSCRKHATHSV